MSYRSLPGRSAGATKRVALAAVAVLMGACASVPYAGAHGQAGDSYGLSAEPLHARLYEPFGGQLRFAVSRPAYVAVFEIVPGGRLSMLYPMTTSQTQRRFTSGSHSFNASRSAFSRQLYTYASGYRDSFWPSYFVLIASERPLRVQRLVSASSTLLMDFGFSAYHSMANAHAVHRLAEYVVPDPDVTDWTYDTYVAWPRTHLAALPTYYVVCADGSVRVVVAGRIPADCRRTPTTPADTAKAPPRDTSDVNVRPQSPGRPPQTKPPVSATSGERERDGSGIREGTRAVGRGGERQTDRPGRLGTRAGGNASGRTADVERGRAGTASGGRQSEGRQQPGRPAREPSAPARSVETPRPAPAAPPRQPEPARESRPAPSGRGGGSAADT